MADSGWGLLAAVAVRTALVFLLLVVGVRLTGKRQTGEMNLHDLLIALIMANAVQNSMTKGDGRLGVALVSAGVLLLLGGLFAVLTVRRPAWEPWLVGAPTVLVQDGRVIRQHMRHQGVSDNDLMAAVRDQGVGELAGVRLAVLEVDGTISVIPREQPAPG